MALIDILQDGQTAIELVAEISHRDPETDTESVTYLSRHGTVPSTGPSDTPANQTFPSRLLSIGPIRESLNEDLLFSGLSSYELGGLTVDNTPTSSPPAPGPLDSWINLSFAGKDVVIKAGAQGAAYSTFETIASGTSNGNPTFHGNEISLSLQSVFSKLDVPLIVNRYSGNSSCLKGLTATGAVTRAHNTIYDLTSYTLSGRFRIPVAGLATTATLARKEISATDRNWRVLIGTNNRIEVRASIGGVNTLIGNPTDTFNDNKWRTWVVGVKGGSTSYVMVNGKVLVTTPLTGNPNTSAAILATIVQGMEVNDHVILNSYLTPDEARAFFSSRLEGDETSVVALWRYDDAGGGTVTDYSSSALNATIGGVENTDYVWNPSDLGSPELAGLPMPIVYGDVFNAPLDLIDTVNERDRWHDGLSAAPSTYNTVLTVKVKGVPIAEGVDWDHQPVGDVSLGVIETTSEIDQPATFDTEVDTPGSYPNSIIEFLLVDRGGFDAIADIEQDWLDAMSYLLPSPSSVFVGGSDKTLGGVVGEYLTGIGGHLRLDTPTGKFLPSHLLPAVGPSPVDADDPVLEWVGSPDDIINFGNIANPTSSMSVGCWFKSHRGLQDSSAGLFSIAGLVTKLSSYSLLILADDSLNFNVSGLPSLVSAPFIVKSGVWYFVMGTFDDTANTMSLFLGEQGGSLITVSSAISVTASPGTTANSLDVGNFASGVTGLPHLGSIAHAQVWSKAHTLAQAQTLMDQFEAGTHLVGNEANLLFYAPINDGVNSTTVQNLVGPTAGTISGLCRWAPQLILDFTTAQPNGSIDSISRLIPAGDIEIRYKINHSPLTQSDIAASVTDENALPLKLPYLSLKPDRADIKADFPQTRSILITSPFLRQSAAIYLYNLLSSRFGPDNMLVNVSGISRDGMLLNLTDEIRVIGSHSSLSSGVHFRVVEKSNSLDELTTNLRLALGQIP